MEESKAGNVGDAEEGIGDETKNTIGFFRSAGSRANRNVRSVSLLNGEVGELRMMLADHFFKIREGLHFFEDIGVVAREFQKLNVKTVTASAETSRNKSGMRARHGASVGRVTVSVEEVNRRAGAM